MNARLVEACFDAAQALQLRRAYDLARGVLSLDGPLDDTISRKLASALIRYASADERRGPEEVAQLAVIHLQLASAPLDF